MLIKKIRLENIRSYVSQEFEFPQGSILLSGDIGSGKSSILLAADFALFGLRKSNLSGNALLRNGANSGLVELNFQIDNNEIIIQRRLKRSNDNSVSQDYGFISINGAKKDSAAIELKQAILDLLNYPKELLTKSKSLIYRYTVYTPQEEMKSILSGDKEIRLDTLRRVFDIDKYKRIDENTKIFINYLKQKRRELEGKVYDLDEKKKQLHQKTKENSSVEISLKDLIPRINEINKLVDKKRMELTLFEDQQKKLNEARKEFELNKFKLENLENSAKKTFNEINELEAKINLLKNEAKNLKLLDIEELRLRMVELNKNLLGNKEEIEIANKTINELETKKSNSMEIKSQIISLNKCPLCKQEVTHEHKLSISSDEDKKINEYELILKDSIKKKLLLQEMIKQGEHDLDLLKEQKSSYELNKLKLNDLQEKESKKKLLFEEHSRLNNETAGIKDKIFLLDSEIHNFKDLNYEEKRRELDELLKKERSLEIERATYLANTNELNKVIQSLNGEIAVKTITKNNIEKLNDLQFWLEEYFIRIVGLIEKQVMLRVHNDFNSLFEKWFNMLMENENFKIRLDEEFSPLIQQNGHDIEYLYLSGGEKTAIALAYRLALNQVINNLITTIKTKDLLILDEPTDGFSDEQLDRVRNVLAELKLKQLIIVSHEQKIESFVDNIVRLNKEEHITKIIQ